ncbi:MAG: helix-turn-helix domain-containing protein [Rhodobacterales bacterium]
MQRRFLVANRIRERRLSLGLKQADVALAAGISPSYLNLIEHNRRGIAGKVLLDIAAALRVDSASILEGADSALMREIEAVATGDVLVELDRAEDMVTRFPGWSRLLAQLGSRVQALEATVEGLSDRLTHDPFLSESLHAMLSSVTAIQATSGILAQTQELEPLQQRRFQANIYDESARLSDLSQSLARYFDRPADDVQATSTPLDEVDVFLSANNHHFPALEVGTVGAVEKVIAGGEGLVSQAARSIARGLLLQYVHDAETMPLDAFLTTGRDVNFETSRLAQHFGVALPSIFRRLAFLPQSEVDPRFGLIQCDASGAVLLRKSLHGFALPRYGAACSLLPLYQALGRPHIAFRAVLQTPDDISVMAEAFCIYLGDPGSDAPPILRATMVIRPYQPLGRAGGSQNTLPVLRVGSSCRVCPHLACAARREPSIHAASN